MSSSAVRMGRAFVEIGADPSKLMAALKKAQDNVRKFGAGLQSMGTKMMAVGSAMAAPLALASASFSSFDDAIRATAAVTGAAGQQLQMLSDRARLLGATTSFTALEVANLMTELGRAGFSPDEIVSMTSAVLDLARATGTDATLASGIMAATLRQFSLGASEAARAADVLTTAANATFNTVEGLGESLKFAGPVAKSLGMSLEDTVAILGVLGNVGIQGSEAGTALRRLAVIAAGSGEELQKLFGISNTDAAGNLKPLVDILDEINTVTANMPVAERTAKMAQAFGLLGITSANVLSQSAGGVAELADKLRAGEGAAARTAKQMDAGLGGSVRIALSAVGDLALSIGQALAPTLQSAFVIITQLTGGLSRFVQNNETMVVSVAKGVGVLIAAGVASYVLGGAMKVLAFAMGIVNAVMSVMLNMWVLIPTLILAAVGTVLYFGGVFNGLGQIFSATLGAMYEAMVAGDLSAAMEVLWLGLQAAWLQGVANFMSVFEPFIDTVLNTFTYAGTAVAVAWENMWSMLAQATNTAGAVLFGIFDNIVNGVMASWDFLVAEIRKSWNYVQSFFRAGFDLKAENDKVDSEMAARARERDVARPGVTGRMAEADERNQDIARQTAERTDAMNRAADEQAARRNEGSMAQSYQDAANAAMARQAARTAGLQPAGDSAAPASSRSDIQELAKQIQSTSSAAVDPDDAASSSMPAGDGSDISSGGASGGPTAESIGTFSAAAVGGMGTATQMSRMEDLLARIAKSNEQLAEDGELATIA